MRVYTKKAVVGFQVIYRMVCENCGHEYEVKGGYGIPMSLSNTGSPPSDELFIAAAEYRLNEAKERLSRKIAKKNYPYLDEKKGKCPKCDFVPTYLIQKGKYIFQLFLVVLVASGIITPIIAVGNLPEGLGLTLSIVCGLPLIGLFYLWIKMLNPNRKIRKAAKEEGRIIAVPVFPEATFGENQFTPQK